MAAAQAMGAGQMGAMQLQQLQQLGMYPGLGGGGLVYMDPMAQAQAAQLQALQQQAMAQHQAQIDPRLLAASPPAGAPGQGLGAAVPGLGGVAHPAQTSMSSSILAQAQAQLAALKSQQSKGVPGHSCHSS